jgi:hypothetical protein
MAGAASTASSYWEERKNFLYYQVVRIIATGVAGEAKSVLDVGSSGCPYLDWFPEAEHRTSLDLRKPYVAEGIDSVTSNYLTWEVDRQYDLVLCLQVLEHVRKADEFAQKLLASGKIVVVSVPYKWSEGSVSSHVHDPVDEAKLRKWFGREPNYSYICAEVNSGARRLICVYDAMPQKWKSLKQRDILLGKPQPAPRPKTAKQLAALENKRRNRKKSPVSLLRRAKNLAKRVLGRA